MSEIDAICPRSTGLSTATQQRKRTKVRAYELARQLGTDWRDLQALAAEIGIEIKNQLNGLDEEQIAQLREYHASKHKQRPPAEVSPEVETKVEVPVEPTVEPTPTVAPSGEEISPAEVRDGRSGAVSEPPVERVQPADQVSAPTGPTVSATPPAEAKPTGISKPVAATGVVTGPAEMTRARPTTPPAPSPSGPSASATGTAVSASPGAPPASPRVTSPAVSPPKPAVPPPSPDTAQKPTSPAAAPAASKPVKHLVNLDQLRKRQQELKQQQSRPPTTPPATTTTPAAPTSPAAPSAPSGGAPVPPPTSPAAPPVVKATGGPIPVLQKPKPKGPADSTPDQGTTSPKTPPSATPGFIIRRQPIPEKKKEKQPKKEQAQKPLATLEEWQQQQQQQRVQPPIQPPSPAAPTALKAPEKTQPTVKLPLDLGKVKITTDEEEEEGRPIGKRRPGQVIGREERRQRRREEARLRAATTKAETLAEQDQETEIARPIIRRPRPEAKPPAPRPVTQPRKGKVPIEPPITVRSLSEALGVSAQELIRKLVQRGQMLNINATLTPELAEELALEYNLELEIKKPADPEEEILKQLQAPDRPEDLVPRPPVVTVMGHVDHGKTSLLDRIRESDVASTEAGGITQHLRAWQVERAGKRITFLDTPGHEAFTAMRARGAQVTDIVVLVVAADDGVMPQTEEAISHARAANVPIIVAINKVDLPNANVQRTRNQLYSLGLIPDTMGGDTPFVETVAAKERPRGIQELLDMILLVAELRELKANPKKPAMGTCLEAKVTEGQGVVATLLVQNGTLHVGDAIVCGCSYGRVRAMFDANGKPLQEAGPATPVAVTGLDDIPEADDKFFVVPDLATAREIAERRRERRRLAAPVRTATLRLEDLDKTKLQELKLILKADVRGSIEAIKKELEKLQSDEIRLNVIHAGVGAITEGDVQLALASPEDTLIVGFNVVPDHRAQTLAEQRQVPIRLYNIIYQLTDDLKAALEGRLKPREEIVPLGRAVVREVFKISKVGTIAGCYVTQGVVERGAMVRVIREGRIIYPPPDRTATIESLRRFKEDVREVREGFECGIKISNFDDVKVDDVLEVYRIVQVQRTLDGTTARATS